MRVLTADPPPAEVQALLERRRTAGADSYDEIWDGVLHMAPMAHSRHGDLQAQLLVLLHAPAKAAGLAPRGPVNVGEADNFRVPDAVLLSPGADALYLLTVALAAEVVSPGDETWEKLPFYAARDVDEVLILDPEARTVHWLALTGGEYQPVEHSNLIDLGPARLGKLIDWPPTEA